MKPLAFVLFALVGSMILAIPMQAYADVQLDSLLRIANQARDNIKIRLSQLETVPNEISKLYEQGSAETDALAKSVLDGDITASKQHFLSAMKLFKDASDKIPIVVEPLPPTDTSRLRTMIVRIENDANRLKAVATKNNIEIDFTEFDNLIQIAKQNLDAGNMDVVNKTLGVAKQFILDAYNSISEVAKQRTSDRAKGKLDASTVNRINAIITQFESKLDNLNKNSQDDDSRIKIKTANDMIVELKQLVLDGNLKGILQKINSIKEILNSIKVQTAATNDASNSIRSTDSTSKATSNADSKVERIKAKIQTLEEQLNNLSEIATENEVATKWITRAFSLLENAKLQLDASPEKAMNTLNEIDKIIHMVQKLVS